MAKLILKYMHKLKCGDSTSIDDLDDLMKDDLANVVFTSPPYNGNTHLDYGKGNNKKLYSGFEDNKDSDDYVQFCHDILNNLFLKTKGFIFWNVMHNANSRSEYIKSILPFLENLQETIVWKKRGMPISSGLTRNFEFIFLFANGNNKHVGETFDGESNFWEVSNANSQDKETHRACFPVELPQKGIELGSKEGEIVLDPFNGSGSTLIACQKSNRRFRGMELSEQYCDLTINRFVKMSNLEVILESTNELFEEVSRF